MPWNEILLERLPRWALSLAAVGAVLRLGDIVQNSISKGILIRFAELSQSGGGVRAIKLALCAALLAAGAGAQPSADWRIDTFAGLPELGDNGPAIDARLFGSSGVAVDGAGNLYITDRQNDRIRKVDSSGTITTIAGSGEPGVGEGGFSGDGGPATEARLAAPTGVAVDGAGNLYITDRQNDRIRKVDSSGTITTIAGSGEPGVGGGGFSGDGGLATEAQLRSPTGVAVDGVGNLYIADSQNHRIRILTQVIDSGERAPLFEEIGGLLRPRSAVPTRTSGGKK